uniref:Cystathionine beta-synthase n=1 Tax=Rhabditophanes sp. KR3021 TaxID=114890 RepID=A0AC35TGF4_9BILA
MATTTNNNISPVFSKKDNFKNNGKILDNVLDAVGNTQLVRLNKIPLDCGIQCNIYVKPEFLNSGGSLRDRIAIKLIEHAEESGLLKKGMTIIEEFNGLALAIAAAVKGYKIMICMPEDVPVETEVIAKALGSKVIRTNSNLKELTVTLEKETVGGIILNESEKVIHDVIGHDTIEREILNSLNGAVDMLVLDNTPFSKGIAKKITKEVPEIKIIFVNNSNDQACTVTDQTCTVTDKDACNMSRRLIKEEGLLCGQISGQNVLGALIKGKQLKKGQNLVVILPDGVCDYMTHFVDDAWMVERNFMEKVEYKTIVPNPEHPFKDDLQYDPSAPPKEAWKIPKAKAFPSPHKDILIKDILGAIGHTPLVKLQKIPQSLGIEADILVKCEFVNPGGSIKDRPALRMIESAEEAGILKHSTTIIESTSGNTGLGLALIGCVKNYRTIIAMPENMSKEKEVVLKALGAETDSVLLDQYTNQANPQAHYLTTGEEILYACDGKVDMVVAGTGTTGTLCGIGKRVKEVNKNCQVIGVDPCGSLIADPTEVTDKKYGIEGIGHVFRPNVLDMNVIDRFVKINDQPSFEMALRLIREEGILCGGTSGANVLAALQEARKLKKGDRVVVVLPDGVRNYLTKFVDEDWMKKRDYCYPK